LKQVSVRLDDALHKKLKYLMLEIDKSINEYILELIKRDIEERGK
jgi:predicted DNA-binding protein